MRGWVELAPHTETPVLQVRDLRTHFFTKKGVGKAVDGVSFDLYPGETLGVVGESGCGKSMMALSILRLHPQPASRIVEGSVLFQGENLLGLPESAMRRYRGKEIALVLQDPMAALNPVLTIGEQIYEALRVHQKVGGQALRARAVELLKLLQVPDAESRLSAYPHQLSGGIRQRVVGAIALSSEPTVLIADEPTTSLDVTIQAAYLELLKDIQRRTNVAILFITHDFGVVQRMCDQVAVMYAGKIVETADARTILSAPAHPYTQALVRSVLDVTDQVDSLDSIEGQPPSIYELAPGCPFAARCPYAEDRCWDNFPPKRTLDDGHSVSCWRYVDDASC